MTDALLRAAASFLQSKYPRKVNTMKLTFIGVGSAFTKKYWQSNMLLETGGKRLLIDCGTLAHLALRDLGLAVKDIDALYVSHPHADHIGGIEEFALMSYFNPNKKSIWTEDPKEKGRPTLYVDQDLCDKLWEESLKGGLRTLQNQVASLDTYFNVVRVPKNREFDFAGVNMRTVQVIHVMDGYSFMPSYGLMWTGPSGKRIFLTTDTQHCPNQIRDFYRTADIVFQDAETTPFESGVHAHYNDLVTLAPDFKEKMWLYHYADSELPDAEADGFAGFVQQGQVFEL